MVESLVIMQTLNFDILLEIPLLDLQSPKYCFYKKSVGRAKRQDSIDFYKMCTIICKLGRNRCTRICVGKFWK